MKYLYIILLAVVFCFNSFGQVELKNVSQRDPTTIILGGHGLVSTTIGKSDTVRVIMLCADTSNAIGVGKISFIGNAEYDTGFNMTAAIFWQFGYLVTGTSLSHTFISYYLDEKQKPLPKSIIVFQSLSLK